VFSCFQLTVVQGDIEKVEADAIIHPTDGKFTVKSDVGKQYFSLM